MSEAREKKIRLLLDKGVTIPAPGTIEIGPEVDPGRVSGEGVTIFSGCRILGGNTLIMRGTRLGYEAPVTVVDCQVGPGVELKGGFFSRSTFLDGASMGSGAQVREGCLLEEESGGAHAVGLKQTILLPFVRLGSLINFCDCLMAGGTSRKDHSEVGSSYIHFNYTPLQDKATPSLIGDVPHGVMLNQRPIFLGGQGGLVGPSRLGYGTVIAAGTIFRGDSPEGGKLLFGGPRKANKSVFHTGVYWSIRPRTLNNVNFIANLCALRQWYLHARAPFFSGDAMGKAVFKGAIEKIEMAINERITRLGRMVAKLPASAEICEKTMKREAPRALLKRKRELFGRWQRVEDALRSAVEITGDAARRDTFLSGLSDTTRQHGSGYLEAVRGLGWEGALTGTDWLQGIVDGINSDVLALLPSFAGPRREAKST